MNDFKYRKAFKVETPKNKGYIITDGEGGAIWIQKDNLFNFVLMVLDIWKEYTLE